MSLRDVANITLASLPFSIDPEIHVAGLHQNHVGFRADRRYFEANPKMHYAIRRALAEFDWIADFCDCPPPPLYVFVMKCNHNVHSVETMWRGTPHWKEVYCGRFLYSDLQSNTQAHELMRDCMNSDGMNANSWAQFEAHSRFVTRNRVLIGADVSNEGKAVN
jgi:hypothetical protein